MTSLTGANAAKENAECPICFEDLCQDHTAVFLDASGTRVCRHFLHEKCMQQLSPQLCPLCRAPFKSFLRVPSIEQ
ncbi:hypothetical protein CYMTET_40751, partial [Cymbomonas tetramitiformis]